MKQLDKVTEEIRKAEILRKCGMSCQHEVDRLKEVRDNLVHNSRKGKSNG